MNTPTIVCMWVAGVQNMLLVIKFVYPGISNALTSQSCESEVLFVGAVHFVACICEGLPLQYSVSAEAFDFLKTTGAVY